MKIAIILMSLNVCGFLAAYFYRGRHFNAKVYDATMCLTAAMMFAIIVFDFMPHLFADFTANSEHIHSHEHQHEHSVIGEISSIKVGIFIFLILFGYTFQTMLERAISHSFTHKLENLALIVGMFLHAFTESAVLYDGQSVLNKSLFTGILLHSIPLSFVIAYTLLSKTNIKMAVLWFAIFLMAVPCGIYSNSMVLHVPKILLWISIFISGLMLHVIWHIWENVKAKSWTNYIMLAFGLAIGFGVTWFHGH